MHVSKTELQNISVMNGTGAEIGKAAIFYIRNAPLNNELSALICDIIF